MKYLLLSLLIIFSITGCQDSHSSKKKISLMGGYTSGVNPNSIAYQSANDVEDRKNKIEISKIDSNAKIEIAKIQSENQLLIAQVNADSQQKVAKTDSTTRIQTSQIDALTKKDDIQNTLYISIAFVIVLLLAALLFYINNKRNRDLKDKIHQDDLKHAQLLKEREFDEKRLHKMLDLVEKGKLSPDMEKEVIASLTRPTTNLLESK